VFSFNSHDPNHILTSQTLILMGIGAGTAIGAAMIEQSKKNTEKVTAFVALNEEIADVQVQCMSDAQLKPQIDRLDALARDLASEGFLKDVLTDVNGISLHRVQQLVWTMLLGLIFIYLVITSHKMPDFDNYVLGVLGISGATYLGFKIPEQPNRTDAAQGTEIMALSDIETIVIVIMENRSFDHMLGYLSLDDANPPIAG